MGGPGPQTQTQEQRATTTQKVDIPSEIRDPLMQTIRQVQTGVAGMTPPALATGFTQFAPNLIEPGTFQTPTQLDPRSQALVSAGRESIGRQAGQRKRAISQGFAGQPGTARALQAGVGLDEALAANPLMFQAGRAQEQRALEEFKTNLAVNEMVNRLRLAGGQESARLQQLQNAALLQQFGLGQAPMQAQQNLIQLLASLAPMLGATTATQVGTATGTQKVG